MFYQAASVAQCKHPCIVYQGSRVQVTFMSLNYFSWFFLLNNDFCPWLCRTNIVLKICSKGKYAVSYPAFPPIWTYQKQQQHYILFLRVENSLQSGLQKQHRKVYCIFYIHRKQLIGKYTAIDFALFEIQPPDLHAVYATIFNHIDKISYSLQRRRIYDWQKVVCIFYGIKPSKTFAVLFCMPMMT